MGDGVKFRRALRVHPRRGIPPGLELFPVPWAVQGRFTADDVDPGDLLAYHTGSLYPQDAASQVPVILLAPRPGEIIIDACAAPGSKSTQIGLALGDDGLLVCCDASAPRRRVLAENLARQGITCAIVTQMPIERMPAEVADAVLVDAPCSGHVERSERQVARMALRQGELLHEAAALVRPGGRIVYSTCTPYRGENEGVVEAFLATHQEWEVSPATLPGTDSDQAGLGGIRLSPERQQTEPFFAIRLQRRGSGLAGGFAGSIPIAEPLPWLPQLNAWKRGNAWFCGSPQVAACALPSEARALVVAHGTQLEPWGAQLLIDRGAACEQIEHALACRLWAGQVLDQPLPGGALVRTVEGLPLGQLDASGSRLALPSRLFRPGVR